MTASVSTIATQLPLRARLSLFLISLAPVAPLLAVRVLFQNPAIAALIAIIGLAPILLAREFHRILPPNGDTWTLDEMTPSDEGFTNYALGFLLPAILVPLDDPGTIAALALFFAIFGWIWSHGYLGHQNPALALLGWHCYSVRVHRGELSEQAAEAAMLLTDRQQLGPRSKVQIAAYDGPIWYSKAERKGGR
jgi:hypothetical protein